MSFLDTAEYHELFMAEPWQRLMPGLRTAVPTAPRCIVEVGAGSGMGTLNLAAEWPGARVVAVEPDATMRAILMGRLAADQQLRARVDVVPMAVGVEQEAALVRQAGVGVDLVLAAHMIGILTPEDRAVLYRVARGCLADDGVLVVTVGQPHAKNGQEEEHGHDEEHVRSVTVGTQVVEERWRPGLLAYRHLDASGRVLREVAVERHHQHVPVTAEMVVEEAAAEGMEPAPGGGDGLLVLRRM